jgi:hypothetical protein
MSAPQNVGALKCQLLKMSAPQNVGALKCQLLKMSALKKYSKFKSKCAYINYSKSKHKTTENVSAYNPGRRPNSYYLGSAGSPLCSPSQPGWSSRSSRSTRSEGVAPPPSGPQVGSVHKSAQLIWAACLPYWHGWWYWHAMTKTCQNVGALGEMSAPMQNVGARRHFDHFSKEKSKS